jgi:queuine tRNA-ribosyltransferase
MTGFQFRILARDGAARRGEIVTPRGTIRTPAFMPVGTVGTVKAMYAHEVEALGADIVLGNVYHLMLHPTAERVARLGGLHEMMQWRRPILTDSGGFQVMSLAKLRKLDERGVTFQSHLDGSKHELTPERSMEIQSLLGSDIQMQLDECVRLPTSREDMERAMRLSLRWAERSRAAFSGGPGQAAFGIVQGGTDKALRIESARALADMDFHGLAIGGLAVGEPQAVMLEMIETVEPYLPQEKPRYLMGVGTPDDLLQALSRGVDMFDCVMPTRAGRHGLAYTRLGRMNLKNARFQDDSRPIDETSAAYAGRQFSRAYLRHLVKSGEILGMMALTAINIAYYQQLMAGARDAIAQSRLADYVAETRENWARGEAEGAQE